MLTQSTEPAQALEAFTQQAFCTSESVEKPTKVFTAWLNPASKAVARHVFAIRFSHTFNGQVDWTELEALTNDTSLDWQLSNIKAWTDQGYQVVCAGVEYDVFTSAAQN